MEILVSFDSVIQELSNDTKFDMFDFILWEVMVKKVKEKIPENGKRVVYHGNGTRINITLDYNFLF